MSTSFVPTEVAQLPFCTTSPKTNGSLSISPSSREGREGFTRLISPSLTPRAASKTHGNALDNEQDSRCDATKIKRKINRWICFRGSVAEICGTKAVFGCAFFEGISSLTPLAWNDP